MPERPNNVEKLLSDYDAKVALHESFRGTCETLIRQLLRMEGLRVHSVTSRVKERSHLAEKLSRFGKDYATLSDITDIVGIRVITHFEDDVDRIAAVVQREFDFDESRSVDKRKALDPDRFGYISVHFICNMRHDRSELAEYREFAGMRCEIQIRSILQHAWAEIEHDLGYKAGSPVPAPIRRRFSRLAGLLEIGDSEFAHIRDDLAAYAARVAEEIRQRPASVGLDDVSMRSFVASDPESNDIDREIATYLGAAFDAETSLGWLAEAMQHVGIQTIEELRAALKDRKDFILKQYKIRVPRGRYSILTHGIGIFHLFQILLAEMGDQKAMEQAFEKFRIGGPNVHEAAAEVFNAIRGAR